MAGIVLNTKPTTRRDQITFSLDAVDLTNATVKWTLYDKWLGADDTAYIPEVRTNGTLTSLEPDLANYFDRTLSCVGPEFTECIFYPNGVTVTAEVTHHDPTDPALIVGIDNYELLVYPEFDDDIIVKPSKMRINYKGIKVAPILSTHKFKAFYIGDEIDNIVASTLVISEEENRTLKNVNGFDAPIDCVHTWKTVGRKYLTYLIWYDDGFRLRTAAYMLDFVIPASEIKDKDDPACVVEHNHGHGHHHDGPPKVYVICTKRCLSGIGGIQEYEFTTTSNIEG